MNKKNVEIVVAKEAGHVFNLLGVRRQNEHDFSDVMAGTSRALLGHCRAATRGASSRWNAHPFCFDNIVGTHNGTLSYQSHNKLAGNAKFETDSEAIFAEIEAYGIAATVKKFKGYKDDDKFVCPDAYALVWYDLRDNTINFLRNKERPLWFAFDTKREQLFWSSEREHLLTAMCDTPHEEKFLYCLAENQHYSWVIPETGKAFGKPKVVRRAGEISTSFTNSTQVTGRQNTQSYGDKTASRFAWLGHHSHFWERFVQSSGVYVYSETEHGKYYDTLQEAWDALPDNEKIRRLNLKHLPAGVNSGYIWREEGQQYVKRADNSSEAASRHTGAKPALRLVDGTKGMSHSADYAQELKEKKLVEATKNDRKAYQVHKSQDKRVYFDTERKVYIVYSFKGMYLDPPWERSEVTVCPDFIPFTVLDVNANHSFKHIGQKKKKVIYFKGFKNEMLVRSTFEKLMKCGCVNCKRTPEWGNPVLFLSNELFMCEFCSKNDEQVHEWRQQIEDSKDKEKVNA